MIKCWKTFFSDLVRYRNYLSFSVRSNLKAELSNTVFGYIWWLLDPLLHMVIYTFLVQVIFRRSTPAFPVYVFCALLPWKFSTASMSTSTRAIRDNASIIKQIYIPKVLLPLTLVLTNTIKFFFGLIILVAMVFAYRINITWHVIEYPLVFLVYFLFYYSLSVLLTHVGVYFADLNNLVRYLMMFWYFASPGIWTLDLVPESYTRFLQFNPNVAFFVSFRNTLMYGQSPDYQSLAIWLGISLVLLTFGLLLLQRSDKNYSKLV